MDKFYTRPEVSQHCLQCVEKYYDWKQWDLVIEPSAGNGSFLFQIPTSHRIGLDLSPDHEDILKQDFLTYKPPSSLKKILVVGNPPFGRVSSLAVKFLNHSATFADVIAMILPRTFRRVSIQKKLNKFFHLIFDEDIPMKPCAFTPSMNAKCCFQIWERKEIERKDPDLPTSHPDWEFLSWGPSDSKGQPTPPEGADFAIRAYGGKCGEIQETNLELLRPKSWHWIKSKIDKKILIQRFQSLDYSCSLNTARQNSIGRGDLVSLYVLKEDLRECET